MNNLLNDITLIILIITKNIFYRSQKGNQDFTLVTAVDDLHFEYLENLLENFKKVKGKFNHIIVYGLNLSDEFKFKIHSLEFVEFREFKFENYPPHFSMRLNEHNNKTKYHVL